MATTTGIANPSATTTVATTTNIAVSPTPTEDVSDTTDENSELSISRLHKCNEWCIYLRDVLFTWVEYPRISYRSLRNSVFLKVLIN